MSDIAIEEPLVTEAETRVAVATQRQLIWWRFRKHKLAVISAVIVALFYLVAIFADCIAYAPPFDTQAAAVTSRRSRSTGSPRTVASIRKSTH